MADIIWHVNYIGINRDKSLKFQVKRGKFVKKSFVPSPEMVNSLGKEKRI